MSRVKKARSAGKPLVPSLPALRKEGAPRAGVSIQIGAALSLPICKLTPPI